MRSTSTVFSYALKFAVLALFTPLLAIAIRKLLKADKFKIVLYFEL